MIRLDDWEIRFVKKAYQIQSTRQIVGFDRAGLVEVFV